MVHAVIKALGNVALVDYLLEIGAYDLNVC